MKAKYLATTATLMMTVLLYACSKNEAINTKLYYGKIEGQLQNMPGTPPMDLYLNGELTLSLAIGTGFGVAERVLVPAGVPVVMELKNHDTKAVLLDSTFTLDKGQIANFNIAYSEDLGIKGFLQSKPVSPDSISFQIVNTIDEQIYPNPDIDLYIVRSDPNTLEVVDTIAILPNFKKGVLMPQVMTIPYLPAYMTLGMLRDRQTGEFIINRGLGLPIFVMLDEAYAAGRFSISLIYADASGYIGNNAIYF